MELQLVKPHIAFKASYLAGFKELHRDSDQSSWIYLGDSAARDVPMLDFESYVSTALERESAAPEGFVCDSVYWAISNGEMVGRISLRHELNDFLNRIGGHIGYIVRPSFRRQGADTEMLSQILKTPKAKAIGRLLLTCDEDNIASEKSILKNNGHLENILDLGDDRPKKKRFWITLG